MVQPMQVHHGGVLGLAETILALSQAGAQLGQQHLGAVAELPQKLQQARFLAGKGHELMRAATCRSALGKWPASCR